MTVKLFPYQRQAVRWIERFKGRALVADEVGLGKTIEAWAWCEQHPELRPVVIVCPASLKQQWQRELIFHFGHHAEILDHMKVPKGKRSASKIFIINYDILHRWRGFLKRHKIKVVILDECHLLGDRNTRRTKTVNKLCRGIKHVLALSGTPFVNRPTELWPILNILHPKTYKSFWSFAMRYTKPERAPWGWVFKGGRRIKELHAKLRKTCLIRRRKEEVLEQLPAKTRFVVPMKIRNRKEYELAEKEFLLWLLKTEGFEKAQTASRAQKMVKVGYLLRLAAKKKLRYAFQWIDKFLAENTGKLILFAVHRRIIERLHKRYEDLAVFVHGGTPRQKRQERVDAFCKSKRVRVIIGQIKVLGTGYNLTAANTSACVELGWTPPTQSEGRAHRIGQTLPVNIYYLIAHNTVEEKLCQVSEEKQLLSDGAIDGRSVENLNIFDMLLDRLKEEALDHADA